MTPYLTARKVHEADPENVPWEEVIAGNGQLGVVIIMPDLFLAMRPIVFGASLDDINDPCSGWDSRHVDCWHVYLAAGDLSRFFDFCPYELPLVSFVRKNRLHFQNFHRLKAKLQSYGRQSKTRQRATEG